MWPGTRQRAKQPVTAAATSARSHGGCTFAEDPARASPDARLIWHARVDGTALRVAAVRADAEDSDRFDVERVVRWPTIVGGADGREHAVLSDGYRHLRLDIEEGSLAAGRPILLRYRLDGVLARDVETRLAPLRRLAGVLRTGRFPPALFPRERRIERLIDVLRVADALHDGASQRDIAATLFGEERIASDWRIASDSLRSRVRRLVREARRMTTSGWRNLLRDGSS